MQDGDWKYRWIREHGAGESGWRMVTIDISRLKISVGYRMAARNTSRLGNMALMKMHGGW